MEFKTIAAGDVKPGDRLFNSSAARHKLPRGFHWVTVKEVRFLENNRVEIETTAFTTFKHRLEGIAVRLSNG